MTATEAPPKTALQKHGRAMAIGIFLASILGAGATFYFYKRYADVWLRQPPQMPMCMSLTRRLLMVEETVSGSIPYMGPDENLVYLTPNEERAVRCLGRISSSTASHLAAALAEPAPDKRARALAAMMRDHVSPDPSADAEAVGAWLLVSGAFKRLPESQEIDALRDEINQRNACRFSLRSVCPSRPPMPLPVWIFGAPSSLGLVVSFGWGAKSLVMRARDWWQKRKLTQKPVVKKNKKSKKDESKTKE